MSSLSLHWICFSYCWYKHNKLFDDKLWSLQCCGYYCSDYFCSLILSLNVVIRCITAVSTHTDGHNQHQTQENSFIFNAPVAFHCFATAPSLLSSVTLSVFVHLQPHLSCFEKQPTPPLAFLVQPANLDYCSQSVSFPAYSLKEIALSLLLSQSVHFGVILSRSARFSSTASGEQFSSKSTTLSI